MSDCPNSTQYRRQADLSALMEPVLVPQTILERPAEKRHNDVELMSSFKE